MQHFIAHEVKSLNKGDLINTSMWVYSRDLQLLIDLLNKLMWVCSSYMQQLIDLKINQFGFIAEICNSYLLTSVKKAAFCIFDRQT